MSAATVTAICFILLAVAHSVLGEARIIRPILCGQIRFAMPRPMANTIVRFAWHATSLAWLAIGLSFLGAAPVVTVSIAALIPGVVMLIALRGHPGWPLFLLAGFAALYAEELLPLAIFEVAAYVTAIGLFAAAAIHVYWACGGKRGLNSALPRPVAGSGFEPVFKPVFKPGMALTLFVAILLATYAAVLGAVAYGFDYQIARWIVLAGIALFV
ncbi:MAG: DUF3995 domain-containing protein, partial [Pseudomonadales bacterium]